MLLLTAVMLAINGCVISIGGGGCFRSCDNFTAKYHRTEQLTGDFKPGKLLEAQTHNGSITVAGTAAEQCRVTATIELRAHTDERANTLGEQVEVRLVPSAVGQKIEIIKPKEVECYSLVVSLDIELPENSNLKLGSHNGKLRVSNIAGELKAKTHNGKVTSEKIGGDIDLQTHNGSVDIVNIDQVEKNCRAKTHNGSINCSGVNGVVNLQTHNGTVTAKNCSGDIRLETHNQSIIADQIAGDLLAKTHNGKVSTVYSKTASGICNISITSHNGRIDLTVPPDFSARADMVTRNGSIHTDLPIVVKGKVDKKKLHGIIGDGQGKLHLETYNGSIHLK